MSNPAQHPQPMIDSQKQASLHSIRHPRPAITFISGAVLGNGGMGVVVRVRPDGIMLNFGHNSVWDVRLAENHRDEIGTFAEVFERIEAIGKSGKVKRLDEDPWFAEYMQICQANYREKYPRPYPCGSVVLGIDRRQCEMLGYELDISSGVCRVDLICDGKPAALELFVEPERERLWAKCVDADGKPCQPFTRVRVLPDPNTPPEFPAHTTHDLPDGIGFSQVLPKVTDPTTQVTGDDHSFRLLARVPGAALSVDKWPSMRGDDGGDFKSMDALERGVTAEDFALVVDLDHADSATLPDLAAAPSGKSFAAEYTRARQDADTIWRDYWQKSGVQLADADLEAYWYRNIYFLRCAIRPGVTCPGLFANWSYAEIGSSWHGDYHMNYNTQQPFWATFSSNHLELNLPYCDLVDKLMPVSLQWAKEYYSLRGAYFPHSAYPVPMTMNPYPVPTWGWEICETPWTVQGMWWHYTYSMDVDFLRDRAFTPIREACRFVADYMLRPEARGERFDDDCYHIFPSVAPELYGLRLNFEKNYDPLIDLTLTRFIFKAFEEACTVLKLEEQEAELLGDIKTILARFPELPKVDSPEGPVWIPVPGSHPEQVQNVPASTMSIFPGEEHGLHSDPEDLELARRTLRIQQNEGGNELVFLNLQKARVGVLDVDKFKRQLDYCQMPNGTCTDLALQTRGRYSDLQKFDFMANMGIWFENFGIPVVINECLMQSWDGIIHLFPNWDRDAAFENLRAVGAFMVSAQRADGQIKDVGIYSEAGGTCRLHNPWPGKAIKLTRQSGEETLDAAEILSIETQVGECIGVTPAN